MLLLLPLLTTAWALSVGPHPSRLSTTNIIPRAHAPILSAITVLSADDFERASTAHRTILALKRDAPDAFASPPADETIFSDDIKFSNDVGLQVVSGRAAYLEALGVVRQAVASPLVPLEITERVRCKFEPNSDSVRVQWRVPVRVGGGGGGATVELSGLSTYSLNGRGKLGSHTLSDLRVNQRRLPSSTLGAWLELLQKARGPGPASPGSALLLLMETLKAERDGGEQGGSSAAAEADEGTAAVDDTTPLPGTDSWAAYERRHSILFDLSSGFDVLLDREPPLGSYEEGVELVAESGEVLVSGLPQYKQLLATLRNVHGALSVSPLLQHSFEFEFVDGKEEEEEVRVAWRYQLEGVGSGRSVVALEATSKFDLKSSGEDNDDDGDTVKIVRHALIDLKLNGRTALPAPLLEQLRRVQNDAPELVKFVSSTLLAVSGRSLGGSAGGRRGATRDGAPPAMPRPAVPSSTSSSSASFASGYVRLLKALHRQLPLLLSEAIDLDDIAVSNVEVRGLLREPLLQGRQPLNAALGGLRRIASLMLSEGALSVPSGGDGLDWRIEVDESLGVVIRWSLSFEFGGAEKGRIAPRVAVPGKVEGEVLLGLAEEDARVREVWVRRLALNGQELLPKRLSDWIGRAASASSSPADVVEFVRSVVGVP